MLEYYLALPLRYLATISGQIYNGEVRNGFCSHIFAGWALTLTLGIIVRYLATSCVLEAFLISLPACYGIVREVVDARYKLSNFNKKSIADIVTWELGCLIGIGVICLI